MPQLRTIDDYSNVMQFSIDDVKKHLNIDEDFTDDDMYIKHLIKMAEQIVELDIDQPLSELKDPKTHLVPRGLRHAMLLLIGTMYANRESVAYSSAIEVPNSYKYILRMYRNYDGYAI